MEKRMEGVVFWILMMAIPMSISLLISEIMIEYFSELDIHYFFSAILQGFAALLTLSFMVIVFFINKLETEMRDIRSESLQYIKGYTITMWDPEKIIASERNILDWKRMQLEFRYPNRDRNEYENNKYVFAKMEMDSEHHNFLNKIIKYPELDEKERILKRKSRNPMILMGVVIIMSIIFLAFGSFSEYIPKAYSGFMLYTIMISSWSIIWLIVTLIRVMLNE